MRQRARVDSTQVRGEHGALHRHRRAPSRPVSSAMRGGQPRAEQGCWSAPSLHPHRPHQSRTASHEEPKRVGARP
jgi:hypothetical protein